MTVLTRRTVLRTAALATTTLATTTLAAPFVRGAYAAGKLSFGVWDHWVPGASEELKKLGQEWADKEKVDLTIDLITSNGDKDLLTLMAEGQARSGHDVMGLRLWYVSAQADNFVPVDDVVEPAIAKYGKPPPRSTISPRSRAIGWRRRPATAAVRCRPARASTCSKNMPGSTCRRCIRSDRATRR